MSQVCVVSFRDHQGHEHSVEVAAGPLFEAAALGLRAFRAAPWADGAAPGPGSELKVSIRSEVSTYSVGVRQLQEWLAGHGRSPAEQALKVRLRAALDQCRSK